MIHRFRLRGACRAFSPVLGFVLLAAFAHAQGTLTPPGAPAPTMKSLDQLSAQLTAAEAKNEARIAIDTLPGDAAAKYIISQPGSYYLRGNISLAAAAQSAIRITASDVVLDLNGYALIGPGVATSTVSAVTSTTTRNVIRNGSVLGWSFGPTLGTNSAAADLQIGEIANSGLVLSGTNGLARNVVVNNAGSYGIIAPMVENCTVVSVSSATVINMKVGIDGEIIRGCRVQGVTATGIAFDALGIRGRVIDTCRVASVTSERNAYGISASDDDTGSVTNSFASGITGGGSAFGIYAGSVHGSTAISVEAGSNTGAGIFGREVIGSTVVTVDTSGVGNSFGISTTIARDCRVSSVDAASGSAFGIQGTVVNGCNVSGIGSTTSLGIGIALTNNAVAAQNSVSNCRHVGIRSGGSGIIQFNTIASVGIVSGFTDGVHLLVSGVDNTIEGNVLVGGTGGDYGLRVTSTRNLIIRNRATGTFTGAATGATGLDTPEFNIVASNRFGPMAASVATGEITTTNPNANYSD